MEVINIALVLKTAPVLEPLTLAEVKLYIKPDSAAEDSTLNNLITTAREDCESFQNRAYITQTWGLWLDAWPRGDLIKIPLPPLQSVSSVKYYGSDDTESTMATADYFVDTKSEPGRLALNYGKSWPSITLRPHNGICIEFVAGYGAAAAVPQKVKQAMLLHIKLGFDYHTPQDEEKTKNAINSLLWKDRVVPV